MKIDKEEYKKNVAQLQIIVDRATEEMSKYQKPFIEEACKIVGIDEQDAIDLSVTFKGITLYSREYSDYGGSYQEGHMMHFIPDEVTNNEEYKKYLLEEHNKKVLRSHEITVEDLKRRLERAQKECTPLK